MAKGDMRDNVLKKEFVVSQAPKMHKAYYIVLAIAVFAAVVCAVLFFITRDQYYVNWEEYGRKLSTLRDDYNDYDKVIIKINDDITVTKEEYYKLRIMSDMTFNALLKEYDAYIELNGAEMTQQEKKELKPKRVTDEEIIDNLILLEVGYLESKNYNIFVTYETAYAQLKSNYNSYKEIMENDASNKNLYNSAKDSLEQMQLIAKGMNKTIDEYISYLAQDSVKNMALAQLENIWQAEFQNTNFNGTVDEYIDTRYDAVIAKHNVEKLGLE